MKFEHFVLLLKGWLVTSIAVSGAFAGGLSQIKTETIFGLPKSLVELLCESYSSGGVAALGFISTSFGDFMNKRSGTGNTQFFLGQPTGQPAPIPQPPPVAPGPVAPALTPAPAPAKPAA